MALMSSILGNATFDEYVDIQYIQRHGRDLVITFWDGSVTRFRIEAGASKVTIAEIPHQFIRSPRKTKVGGGGVNSRLAIAEIAELLSVPDRTLYLDFGCNDPFLESQIPGVKSWLNQWAAPHNFVFGSESDKIIFHSPPAPPCGLGLAEQEKIDHFCEARHVLLNAPKDRAAVEAIFRRKAERGFQVIVVLTPSLPKDFLRDSVIPKAEVLIGAWDELGFLLGSFPLSVCGAAAAAMRLRSLTPTAEIHVTMGKHGVASLV